MFDDVTSTFIFSTCGRNAYTIAEHTYFPFNLTGILVEDKIFDGNYSNVKTKLITVPEQGASIWRLTFSPHEYTRFKTASDTHFKAYRAFDMHARYEEFIDGCLAYNQKANTYCKISLPKEITENISLIQEVILNVIYLTRRWFSTVSNYRQAKTDSMNQVMSKASTDIRARKFKQNM
jgi:hypothetical protein